MSERPKTSLEIANEMLRDSKPAELLKERGDESPSLDDHIINEIDITQVRGVEKQGRPHAMRDRRII